MSIAQFEHVYNIQSHKMQENEESMIETNAIKLMLLGKETVGKTSFKCCLMEGKVPDEHLQTYMDAYYFELKEGNGHSVIEYVKIQDSAGQEEFLSIIDQMIFFNDGFIIIYSIDDLESFQQVKNEIWKKILSHKHDQKFYAVLIGNKRDKENERKVSAQEGKALADKLGIPFHEISLKNEPQLARMIFNQLVLSMKKLSYQYPQILETHSSICHVSQIRSKVNSIHSIDPYLSRQFVSNNKNTTEKEENCCCNVF